jgi:radical S-adenosyl methionine domain-containing protein 2
MPQFSLPFTPELVINWHITEACNFDCSYCYATWRKPASPKEVLHHPATTERILGEIADYFYLNRSKNPLAKRLRWTSVRLSIAGGEPLLYPDRVISIARRSRELDMRVSLITNGSKLTEELMWKLAPHLSMIGISIDSADQLVNRQTGREDRKGSQLDLTKLSDLLDLGREINPDLKVKINTVVCSKNKDADMKAVTDRIKPDKWKVLRVLPVASDETFVTQEDFQSFVMRHSTTRVPLFAEDNLDMVESYIMVDPHGRFFQNRLSLGEKGHVHSMPIAEVGAARAFESLHFNANQFAARYVPVNGEEF